MTPFVLHIFFFAHQITKAITYCNLKPEPIRYKFIPPNHTNCPLPRVLSENRPNILFWICHRQMSFYYLSFHK